jgi:hypothetical protein
MPESGLYDIYYIDDPVIGEIIIDFKRKSPYESEVTGNIEEFYDYDKFNNNYYESWGEKSSEFHIIFNSAQDIKPKIIRKASLNATLQINYISDDKCSLEIKSENNSYHYENLNFDDFVFNQNIERFVENWDYNLKAQLIPFEKIAETNELLSFETSIQLNGLSLFFSWGEDKDDYQIIISNIRLLPFSKKDAEDWLYTLILNKLKEEKNYFTLSYVEQIEEQILNQTPLRSRYSELKLGGNRVLEYIINDINKDELFKNLKWKITVAEDLYPEIEGLIGSINIGPIID